MLRDYQKTLLADIQAAWRDGHRRVLAQLPTGGGKGRILAECVNRIARRGKRIYVMAHRAELVEQICGNLEELRVHHGRIQVGWPCNHLPVQVGMVQSIARRVLRYPPPDLLFVDEAHHQPAASYRAIADAWPNAHVLGVTATPSRTDGRGLNADFDTLVSGPDVRALQDADYLARYDYYMPSAGFSMDGVARTAGDYQQSASLRVMEEARIVGDAVAHYKRLLDGRPAIAFCMGVDHCKSVASDFRSAGWSAAHVDGTMPMDQRARNIAALASGELHVLAAADVISEGTDIPVCAGAILLRPTTSFVLYLQQCGRALRPKPDGSRAMILDHVGNCTRHGFPADPRDWSLSGTTRIEAPRLRNCETCFRVFPANEARATARAECKRDPCAMLAPVVTVGRDTPVIEAGELVAVADPWAWTGGIDPVAARGDDFRRLMALASDHARLSMLARARGYKPGWVYHVLRERGTVATTLAA